MDGQGQGQSQNDRSRRSDWEEEFHVVSKKRGKARKGKRNVTADGARARQPSVNHSGIGSGVHSQQAQWKDDSICPTDPHLMIERIESNVKDVEISTFYNNFRESWKAIQDLQTTLQDQPSGSDDVFETGDCSDVTDSSFEGHEMKEKKASESVPDERNVKAREEGSTSRSDCLSWKHIVCYGLGNFSSCVTARYQLALLVLFNSLMSAESCSLYDPNFSELEKQVLRTMQFSVIDRNEEGKRSVAVPTVFFMPHCGKPLYNNLLWANWGTSLEKVVIMGNSFNHFAERFTERQLLNEVKLIHEILPYHREVAIRNNFRFTDIFNDLAFHVFPLGLLRTAPALLWNDAAEPCYDHLDDVEIIRESGRK